MWIARDKYNRLWLFSDKPILEQKYQECWIPSSNEQILYTHYLTDHLGLIEDYDIDVAQIRINSNLFPEITFENSPVELIPNL